MVKNLKKPDPVARQNPPLYTSSLIHHDEKKKITHPETNAPISQTSSERLKKRIQTYRMEKKELKMKLGQLQEEISKALLPVSTDLSNDFKSIIFETHQEAFRPL